MAIRTIPVENNASWLQYISSRLTQAGCHCTIVPSADGRSDGLFARIGPQTRGGIVLSGHVDVVSTEGQDWTSDPFRLRRDGSRLVGRGAVDMKGFVACAIATMEAAATTDLERPLYLALSADEESTCQSAVTLAAHVATQVPTPRGVLVGEPSMLRAVTAHKGSFTYEVDVTGRSAHASMPELGASATALAARLICWIDDQSAPTFATDATTHSVGTVRGGSANNIIAEHCRFEWDVRLAPQDDLTAIIRGFEQKAEDLTAPLRDRVPEVRVALAQMARFPGFMTAGDAPFARECLGVSGTKADEKFAAGTEAGLFEEVGLPVIVMGPGNMAQAHTPDEFIEIAQLAGCMEQLRSFV